MLLKKSSYMPQLSEDSSRGHFIVENEDDETQHEDIAFEVFKHQANASAYVVEFRRANNSTCSFFTLMKEYKQIYKSFYGFEYPTK
jgi:hypothetical protein